MSAALRVLIVAADPLTRTGLVSLLEPYDDVRIVGRLSPGASLPADVEVYAPDLILWDLGWDPFEPPLSPDHRALWASYPIIALLPDDAAASRAYRAGAGAILLRDVDAGRLASALFASVDDLFIADPTIAAALVPDTPPAADLEPPAEDLTPRELEVLTHLAEGLSNRAIAFKLDISENTVKFHVTAIMGKLNARSRTDAVVRATRLGLILL